MSLSQPKRPRIAYVLPAFPGRSEPFIHREIEGLSRRGFKITVIDMGENKPDPLLLTWPSVELIRRPSFLSPRRWPGVLLSCFLHPRKTRNLVAATLGIGKQEGLKKKHLEALRLLFLSWHFANRIRYWKPDLFHAHSARAPATLALLLSDLLLVPWGFSSRSKDLFRHPTGLETKMELAQHILTGSKTTTQLVRDRSTALIAKKVHHTPHGLDLDAWNHRDPCTRSRISPPLLLAAGRFVQEKGFSRLVDACSKLQTDGISFCCEIIGDGPEKARLERSIKEAGLEKRVKLRPWMSHLELRGRYLEASIVIAPSTGGSDGKEDSIPDVILEALALETPVVTSDLPSLRDLFSRDLPESLYPSGSPGALSEKIKALLENPTLRKKAGLAGREIICKNFNLADTSTHLEKVFRESLTGTVV